MLHDQTREMCRTATKPNTRFLLLLTWCVFLEAKYGSPNWTDHAGGCAYVMIYEHHHHWCHSVQQLLLEKRRTRWYKAAQLYCSRHPAWTERDRFF